MTDEELYKQALIEHPALRGDGAAVLLAAETGYFQRSVELFIQLVQGLLCSTDLRGCRVEFSGSSIHLALE
ncbi:hypothetical protein [Microbacterium sp. SORGH_AS_0862]|uniref:hypothetical protein n=1 Tax=Microbacterium sp. SORGH_AS_0862 TaxID=3041789 RepID=UPI0027D84264|nr:hypothetical protein [Microbacterium sp. SORGH_AS_0862]